MTQAYNKNLDGQNVARLLRWLLESAGAAKTGGDIVAGMMPYLNTANNRFETSIDGTNLVALATLDDVVASDPFRGIHDASGGVPSPAAVSVRTGEAFKAGEVVRISVAGTIAGIQGVDDLDIDDMLYALVDAPATAADWWGIQGNAVPTVSKQSFTTTLANLPANTPTDVISTGITTIESVQIKDANGVIVTEAYDVDVDNTANPAKVTLGSLIAVTNLDITFIGAGG